MSPHLLRSPNSNLVLSSSETIEEYYASILQLGSKLGCQPDQLTTNFLNGLPDAMKDFIIGTDNHTMHNYVTHARLYLARHPLKSVRFENQFPVSKSNGARGVVPDEHFDKLKEELLDVVSKLMDRSSLPRRPRTRGQGSLRGRVGYAHGFSPSGGFRGGFASGCGSTGCGNYGGRGRGNFANRQGRTPSPVSKTRCHRYDNNLCYWCGSDQHWARNCTGHLNG